MVDDREIVLPLGYEAVEVDGKTVIQKRPDQLLTKTVSFRMTTEDHNRLLSFLETFPERTWTVGFRWLLEDPTVRDVIAAKVEASVSPS